MGGAEVFGHLALAVFYLVEIGDGGGEMRLARQQNVFGTAGQVSLVLLGQRGDGEGVPAEGVGVGKVCAHARANRPDPSEIKARTNNGKWPKRSEEHTSELKSLMRISYAVFCLKKKR